MTWNRFAGKRLSGERVGIEMDGIRIELIGKSVALKGNSFAEMRLGVAIQGGHEKCQGYAKKLSASAE